MEQKWYEEIINDLEYDDCVFILNTIKGVSSNLYLVENGEYTDCSTELFSGVRRIDGENAGGSVYAKYEPIFRDMMKNDRMLHVFRYQNKQLTAYRRFKDKDYDAFVYVGCNYNVLLRNEFSLEPKGETSKAAFQKSLKKAERFMQTLLYACYVGATEAIVERAKSASKAQLDRKLEYLGTPLSFCAKHNDLEGFRAVAEAGADLTKTCAGGTISPLVEAIRNSPDIVLYVYHNFPEVFEKQFKDWKGGVSSCTDIRIYDLMYQLYGTNGMEKLIFGLVESRNAVGLKYAIEHGADFLMYHDRYYKCNGLGFAEMRYSRYANPDNPYKEVYEMLRDAADREVKNNAK